MEWTLISCDSVTFKLFVCVRSMLINEVPVAVRMTVLNKLMKTVQIDCF